MFEWLLPYWAPPIHWFIAGGIRFRWDGSDYVCPMGSYWDGVTAVTDYGTEWFSADVLLPVLCTGWLVGLLAWSVPSLCFLALRVVRRGFLT